MQVTQVNDHVTHAVIGGKQAIEFGISNSAEFFNILSSTLYKDQKLAVVREVLCNAWDAHIEAGCTDIPVQITLTPEKFIIRDFGKGIHLDDMGIIYGTYGNSTKKNDGLQTGGFGLGCKAPFAYTDHFEVQSSHEGVRTIYNLSKSSAQAVGKPGIVPIASFPTKESGLQVSIDILNPQDYHRFMLLVKRIVRNGDMNMTLNGQPMEKLGFDTTKSNYFITQKSDLLDMKAPLMVRYGNVIYPIDKTPDIAELYAKVETHLHALKWGYEPYYIVFQAPPNSIAIQPSREGLSMQSHTIQTLKTLMSDFFTVLGKPFLVECNKVAIELVDAAVSDADVGELLSIADRLPKKSNTGFFPNVITDLSTMAHRYMEQNYPKSVAFRKKDISYRLRQMVKGGLLARGLVQTYLHALHKVRQNNGHMQRVRNDWLQRRVIGPLVTKMHAAGLSHANLFVFDSNDPNAPRSYYNRDTPPLVSAMRAAPKHLFMALPYLRNIVVLSHTKTDLFTRCKKHQVFKDLGSDQGFLFYHTGLKKADKEQAVEFFTASGMTVVDLTFRQDWEIERMPTIAVATPRKPPKVGVARLDSILYKTGSIDTRWHLEDDAVRITNPEFIINVSTRQDAVRGALEPWHGQGTRYILELFGAKGGITNNSTTYKKWLDKGVKPFEDYMKEKMFDFMLNNQNVQEYWAYHPERVIEAAEFDPRIVPEALFRALYTSPILRDLFGLKNNLTDQERKMLYIWEEYVGSRHYHKEDVKRVQAHLKQLPLALANLQPVIRFRSSKLLRLIQADNLLRILNEKPEESEEVQTAIEILSLALK